MYARKLLLSLSFFILHAHVAPAAILSRDDPFLPSNSRWGKIDTDIIAKKLAYVIKSNRHLRDQRRFLIGQFRDISGDRIKNKHFRSELAGLLSAQIPNRYQVSKNGYANILISGLIECDVRQFDSTVHKKYSIWLKMTKANQPFKQVWSERLQIIRSYSVSHGYIGSP